MLAREHVGELGGLRRRLLATGALLAIFGVLHLVPLPGLDPRHALASGPVMNLMAIGISTSASGFVTVELAALLWPRWRRLRLSLAGRAKLDRAVVFVVMALGAMQVFGVVLSIEHLSDVDAAVPLLQGNAEALVGFSLFTGLLVTFFIARAISKLGMLNGFSVLTLLQALRLSNVHTGASGGSASVASVPHPWALLCGFVLPVLATLACFPTRGTGDGEHETVAPFELPVPASSMHPSAFVVAMLSLPAALAAFFPEGMKPLLSWLSQFGESPWLRAVLTLAVGMLLLWAFARPRSVRSVFSRLVGEGTATKLTQRALRESIAPTMLFLLTLAFSELLLTTLFDIRSLAPLIPTGVAIVLDFMAAVRVHRSGDWSCAWRDPRPYVFPVVQRLLRHSDIAARELSVTQATLFRVFAPFVLTEVWVPTPLASRATQLIEAAFSVKDAAHSDAEAGDFEQPPERAATQRKRLYQLAALAAIACVATASVVR